MSDLSVLSEKHAHMLVVYGRRRVGKTRLVLESLEPMYFFVDKKTSALLLKEFSEIINARLARAVSPISIVNILSASIVSSIVTCCMVPRLRIHHRPTELRRVHLAETFVPLHRDTRTPDFPQYRVQFLV